VVAAVTVVAVVVVAVVVTVTSFQLPFWNSREARYHRASHFVSKSAPALGKTGMRVKQRRNRTDIFSVKEEPIEIEGSIHTVLPGTMFRVELPNKHLVLATISGKMRKRWIRLTVGDRVKLEMSPYDLDKARIVWRMR